MNYNLNIGDRSNGGGGGLSFTGALTIVFIALKLMGFINWSWVWVLAPIWLSVTVFGLVVVLGILIATLKEAKDEW